MGYSRQTNVYSIGEYALRGGILDVFVPGSGIRFKEGVFLDLTNTDSVTIGYTG